MKRTLLFFVTLLFSLSLSSQKEYEIKDKIKSYLEGLMTDISYVNDENEIRRPENISSEFYQGNYFLFNGKETTLEHFIEDYSYGVLRRKVVNHTLVITHNNIQRRNLSDSTWSVKGILEREYGDNSNIDIENEDISFVILFNAIDKPIGILEIEFHEKPRDINGTNLVKNELNAPVNKPIKSKTFNLKPGKIFNIRCLSTFDLRGKIGMGLYGNQTYFQYGFDVVLSLPNDNQFDQFSPNSDDSRKSLEKYYYELSSNRIYSTNGTTLWKTETEYIRPKAQFAISPGINLKYFSLECGIGIFMAEHIIITKVNQTYNNISATNDNKNYFLLRPTLTSYLFDILSASFSYVYCPKAKPFNCFMFGLGLYIDN